jgi:hypothetical protein
MLKALEMVQFEFREEGAWTPRFAPALRLTHSFCGIVGGGRVGRIRGCRFIQVL